MSYIDYIEQVADESTAGGSDLGTQILERWGLIESLAQSLRYDVLDPQISRTNSVRSDIRGLIKLLYHVPGANRKDDCDQLRAKDAAYGGSWCRRGGCGAFMMVARKFDRLETQIKKYGSLDKAIAADVDSEHGEALLDTLGDARRYLILIEAWHVARESIASSSIMPQKHRPDALGICQDCGESILYYADACPTRPSKVQKVVGLTGIPSVDADGKYRG